MGLQLFSLFNILDEDVKGNLQKVASIGYTEIESAFSKKGGFYGMKPKEFASLLKDLGLSWESHHVLGAPFKLPSGTKMPTGADEKPITINAMKNLRDNYQEIIEEAVEGGFPYLVCANTPFGSAEELKESIDTLNRASEAATKAGLQMAYHNHDKEFESLDSMVIYERMLSETNPGMIKMELDLCWAVKSRSGSSGII